MPTHLIFMENNYLFYAQQLWTVSCLRAKASVRYSVLKCFLVHYSIVLFYYTVAECVPLNFRVSEIFRAFSQKFLACARLKNYESNMENFLVSLKYDPKHWASIFTTK